MKKNILLIIAVLIVGVIVSIAIGNKFSPSKSDILKMLFSYPDGSICQHPCILGIQPSVTSLSQALNIMQAFNQRADLSQKIYDSRPGQIFLNTNLGDLGKDNFLSISVDSKTNLVKDISLRRYDANTATKYSEIEIKGARITWRDVRNMLGEPQEITAAAGDGGMIFLAVALYKEGWCIYVAPRYADEYPISIPGENNIIGIEINCFDLQYLKK